MTEAHQIVCPSCAGINRLRTDRDPLAAKCGTCGSLLFSGHPIEVNGARFSRQIEKSTVPVVVDVWAPWCGPCRSMAPAFEAAAKRLEPKVRFLKLNSDDEQETAGRLSIRGIPTMLLYRNGREVARVSGAMGERQIVDWLTSSLAAH
ncbi:thioredoxin TrxC [Rhizobium sp. PAMB 3182]